ncbi:fimbrial protein [Serratia fonticola]|uniref:fimbrial protein n=1 Tax=Serratia fonticola TaxID=47917 RepID=UPI0016450072|nr:type 1 fimbrial protein [Serratia fonticola]MBC3229311.1 type 1 fimbrial protein [Serratia fonticola]
MYDNNIREGGNAYYNKVKVIATPSGAPTRSGNKDIFPTNVPGIGAIFYVSGSLIWNAVFPGIWESASNSVTKWEDFDITLKDCPPFVGYGSYHYMEATDKTTGSSAPNQVAISFNSVHGVVEGNPLLAKLESGPNSAAGIGIELSKRDATSSINLDGSGGFDLDNLPTQDGSSYVIPLKARYVQYESNVKAGIANGATVFTITYN